MRRGIKKKKFFCSLRLRSLNKKRRKLVGSMANVFARLRKGADVAVNPELMRAL